MVAAMHIKDENEINARKEQIVLFEKAIKLLQDRIEANDMLEGDIEPLREILNQNDDDLNVLATQNSELVNNTVNVEGAQFDRLSGFMAFSKNVCK